MPKKPSETKPYPKILYVFREIDGEDTYFLENESLQDCKDWNGELIGIYELKQVGRIQIGLVEIKP